MVANLSAWPWGNFGNLKMGMLPSSASLMGFVYLFVKYLLYAPLVAQVVYSCAHEKDHSKALWCLHILIICGLKGLLHVFWSSFTNMLFLSRTLRINPKGVDFKKIDHEWHWDNYILMPAIIASTICYMSPPPLMMMNSPPLCNTKGLIALIVLHVIFSESLYLLNDANLFSNQIVQFQHL